MEKKIYEQNHYVVYAHYTNKNAAKPKFYDLRTHDRGAVVQTFLNKKNAINAVKAICIEKV